MLRNTCSPSLSPFPPHYTSTGRKRGRQEGEGEMTFSFVLLRAPYYHLSRETLFLISVSLSLSSSNSFFSCSPTIEVFILCLSLRVPCVSLHPNPPTPHPFCSIIAWLINYKGISKSEKTRRHFNLTSEKTCTYHIY